MQRREDLTGELRDLLAVIQSSAAILRRGRERDDAIAKHLERIHEHVRRASGILDTIERS